MIKLNLIQQKKQAVVSPIFGIDVSKLPVRKIIVAGIFFFVVDYVAQEWVFEELEIVKSEREQLRNRANDLSRKIRKHRKEKDELDMFNKQISTLKRKAIMVDKLLKKTVSLRAPLERIALNIKDDMWLNKLSITSKRELLIEGVSLSYKSIGDFINIANNSLFFDKSLKLKSSSTEVDKDSSKRVEKFEIQGKIINYRP